MRHALNLSALALVSALGAQCAGAQNLQLDNFTTALSSIQNQASVTISPSTGNVVVATAQGNFNNCTFPQQTGGVTFNTSNPTSGNISTQVTLGWSTLNPVGTNPCTPTGGAGTDWVSQGAAPGAGARTVTLPGTTGAIVFGMTCQTQAGAQQGQWTVTVTQPQQTGCSGSDPFVMTPISFPNRWQDVFSNQAFPNPLSNARTVTIPTGQAVALQITPSLSVTQGTLDTTESSGNPGGPLRLSISKCAGDFRSELTEGKACLYRGRTNQATLVFATSQFGPGHCGLEAGVTHYVNLTHRVPEYIPPGGNTSHPDYVPPSECTAISCITLLRPLPLGRAQAESLGLIYEEPRPDTGEGR